jgi:large subunit ribosomal protein L1
VAAGHPFAATGARIVAVLAKLLATSAEDIARGVQEAKSGRVDFRMDRTNVLHVILGKVSFSEEQLKENFRAMVSEIQRNRPSGAKGELIRSAALTSTMGPGVRLDLAEVKGLAAAR